MPQEPGKEPTPKDNPPIGRSFLLLNNIKQSTNYTCLATSELGTAATLTQVKVQGQWCSVCDLTGLSRHQLTSAGQT